MTTLHHQQLWRAMLARSFDPREWYARDDGGSLLSGRAGGPTDPCPCVREDSIMWVYRKSEPQLWTVGYYAPDRQWVAESDHASPEAAADRVRWLNGGGATDPSVEEAARRGFRGDTPRGPREGDG